MDDYIFSAMSWGILVAISTAGLSIAMQNVMLSRILKEKARK